MDEARRAVRRRIRGPGSHSPLDPPIRLRSARSARLLRNRPRCGLAQQRQRLLDAARAPFVLFLDADVWLEPGTIAGMLDALHERGGGFVGAAVQGLSYLDDRRPDEGGAVHPEPAPPSGAAA